MRILYLTGHYPPDLTSGATLQVQRLAHAAVRAGHEVRVIAGAYRAGLVDGATNDTVDTLVHPTDGRTTQVPVRWIGTTSWTDQDVDANWWNPVAAAAVGAALDEWTADVVHAHALQTLGAGVIDEAADRGIRTVVTMHDLWWWCARLFLVDPSLQPCSLVTCLGECPCARTADWRVERAERLSRSLARVDIVLTPSEVLRDVAIANGLHLSRVRVDPNDVDPAEPRTRAPHAEVRFLYLGGPNPLKGADVVAQAARHLAGANGWRLAAYGLTEQNPPLPARATIEPPFEPADRWRVMATADVLVLPSVARESFSIAAREALAAGMPVITSDCLGPEEVVRDGVNGLVVPTGDAVALADAMRRVALDADLRDTLVRGAATTAVSTLDADDHLRSLVALYTAPPPPPLGRRALSVLVVVAADTAASRRRGHHLADALRLVGDVAQVVHVGRPDLADQAAAHDVTVLVGCSLSRPVAAAIESARAAGRVVVYDVDDLTAVHGEVVPACDAVIAAADHCARGAGEAFARSATTLPTGVSTVDGILASRARRQPSGRTRIGVIVDDVVDARAWASVEAAVAATLTAAADVELHVVGDLELSDLCAGLHVVRHPLPTWQRRFDLMAALDVVLAPLSVDNRGNHHDVRLALRWMDASLAGCAVVTSDTPTLASYAVAGRDVFVATSPDDWSRAISSVLVPAARQRVAARAHRTVMLRHSPYETGRRSTAVLGAVVPGPRPPVPATSDDGPPFVELTPFTAPTIAPPRQSVMRRIARRLR